MNVAVTHHIRSWIIISLNVKLTLKGTKPVFRVPFVLVNICLWYRCLTSITHFTSETTLKVHPSQGSSRLGSEKGVYFSFSVRFVFTNGVGKYSVGSSTIHVLIILSKMYINRFTTVYHSMRISKLTCKIPFTICGHRWFSCFWFP